MNITELAMLKKITGKGGASIELDTTLTQAGKAADAKAVGDILENIIEGVIGKPVSVTVVDGGVIYGSDTIEVVYKTYENFTIVERTELLSTYGSNITITAIPGTVIRMKTNASIAYYDCVDEYGSTLNCESDFTSDGLRIVLPRYVENCTIHIYP